MPHLSNRQKHANALLEAYILSVIIEAQEGTSVHDTDSTSSGWNTDADTNSNALSGWGSEEDTHNLSDSVIKACHQLYENFYIKKHHKIPKMCKNLNNLLTDYKSHFPDIFCSYLCMSLECFDSLLETIQHHEAFHNNSNNPKMPVERQLAIALYQFGHYRNSVSTLKVALWAGVGYGTVCDVTLQVIQACCGEHFHGVVMQWPTDEEIEQAKVVNGRGNPGVYLLYPYPYPTKPLPLSKG